MRAVIVAAGRSSRLYPLTLETPKCLLPVGEQTMLERSLSLLEGQGVEEIVVVVGFQQERLRAALGERARVVLNPWYATTNNMASLWLALPHLGRAPFVYLHADVVYSEGSLARLVQAPADDGLSLLVDFGEVDEEAMKVRVEDGRFVESSKAIPLTEAAGEWTGLARFSPPAAAAFAEVGAEFLAQEAFQVYDTAIFNRLARAGLPFQLVPTEGEPWYEIDTAEDLARARALFEGVPS